MWWKRLGAVPMRGRDPVTPAVALDVFLRDNGCVAVTVGGQDPATCHGPLTLDHVKDQPKIGDPIQKRGPERKHRYRAASDRRHLVSVVQGPPHRQRLGHFQPTRPAGLSREGQRMMGFTGSEWAAAIAGALLTVLVGYVLLVVYVVAFG